MTLRQLRERVSYRQKDVAERCDVAVQTVYAWEKGESRPRPQYVRALAEMYEVTIAEVQAAVEASAIAAGKTDSN